MPAQELLNTLVTPVVQENLQDAFLVALKIGHTGQCFKTNKDIFQHLVDDACAVVYILLHSNVGPTNQRSVKMLCEFSPITAQNLPKHRILDAIYACIKAYLSKNTIRRAMQDKIVQRRVQEFREQLKSLLGEFGVRDQFHLFFKSLS
ncbi:hypothetical protein H0H92_003263 [Tricholoma furcatifolium]|nr:hypothetical protein H0H92_003263 [Tricholoma furcatifolium]